MPFKHLTAVLLACLFVLMAAGAAPARPLVRGYGCAVTDYDTILELVECFGEPLYTEQVEEYIQVRPRQVVKTTITIWYYRIDESGFNNNELFAFHVHQGKIFKIEQISR